MSRPLPDGDPTQVGPFRLTARLEESAAGVVYLAVDEGGRSVSLAVLTKGAAEDAAARDRFSAAVRAAMPSQGVPGVPLSVWAPAEARRPEGEPRVVAAQPDGSAPWVAVGYEPGRPGAGRFLDAVLFTGSFRDRWVGGRRGPQFQPYWAGSRELAAVATAAPRTAGEAGPVGPGPVPRSLASAVVGLAGMLVILAVLLAVLFACRPVAKEPPPPPPTDVPSSREVSPRPSPSRTPSPSPSRSLSPRPSPSGSPDEGAPA